MKPIWWPQSGSIEAVQVSQFGAAVEVTVAVVELLMPLRVVWAAGEAAVC